MRSLLAFVPVEALPLLVVGAGLAIIVGARGLGRGLLVLAALLVVLPVALAPLFEQMPEIVLSLLMIALVVGLVFSLLRWSSSALIGRRATDHMVGTLAADVVRAVFVGGLRLVGRVLRLAWRMLPPWRLP